MYSGVGRQTISPPKLNASVTGSPLIKSDEPDAKKYGSFELRINRHFKLAGSCIIRPYPIITFRFPLAFLTQAHFGEYRFDILGVVKDQIFRGVKGNKDYG